MSVLWAGLLLGCGAPTPQEDERPPLRIGYAPDDDPENVRLRRYSALANHLRLVLDKPVELVALPDYNPSIEAFREGRVDLIRLGPLAYLIATKNGEGDPLVVPSGPDGEARFYHSVLVSHAEKGPSTLEDMWARRESLSVVFAHPNSTSGYLIPQIFLRRGHPEGKEAFKSFQFANAHALALLLVANGRADLAFVSDWYLRDLTERGKIDPEALRVLWTSAPIPSSPFVLHRAVPQADRDLIREALLFMHERWPDRWEAYTKGMRTPYPKFIPAQSDDYAALRLLVDGEL